MLNQRCRQGLVRFKTVSLQSHSFEAIRYLSATAANDFQSNSSKLALYRKGFSRAIGSSSETRNSGLEKHVCGHSEPSEHDFRVMAEWHQNSGHWDSVPIDFGAPRFWSYSFSLRLGESASRAGEGAVPTSWRWPVKTGLAGGHSRTDARMQSCGFLRKLRPMTGHPRLWGN